MQESKWLVSTQRKRISESLELNTKNSGLDSKNESQVNEIVEYTLSKPNEIVVIDDMFLAQQLYPKSAPSDPLLEQFYLSLGSTWLRQSVKISNNPIGTPEITSASITLEKLIKDRAILLLHEFSGSSSNHRSDINGRDRGSSRSSSSNRKSSKLIRDVESMQERLVVRQVRRIEVNHKFSLTGANYKTLTSACGVKWDNNQGIIVQNDSRGDWTKTLSSFASSFSAQPSISNFGLNGLLAGDNSNWCCILIAQTSPSNEQSSQFWDPFDVSMAIGVLFLKQCKLNDALLISTLLSSSLDSLRRKGFPVDRILQSAQKKKELINASIISNDHSIVENPEKKILSKSHNDTNTVFDNHKASQASPPPYRPNDNSSSSEISKSLIDLLTLSYPKAKRDQIVDAVLFTMRENSSVDSKHKKNFEQLLEQAKASLKNKLEIDNKNAKAENEVPGYFPNNNNNLNRPILDESKNKEGSTTKNPPTSDKDKSININNSIKNNNTNPTPHLPDLSNNAYSSMLSIKQSLNSALKSTPVVSGAQGSSSDALTTFDENKRRSSTSQNDQGLKLSKLFNNFNKIYNKKPNSGFDINNNPLPKEFELNTGKSNLGNAISKFPDEEAKGSLIQPNEIGSAFVSNSVSFCKPLPSQRLVYYGLVNGIDLYLDSNIPFPGSYPELQDNYNRGVYDNIKITRSSGSFTIDNFKLFSCVLAQLATRVFGIPKESMHMFIGGKGSPTIAFNRSKVLFFNVDYFVNLNHNLSIERILIEKYGHKSIVYNLNSVSLKDKDVRDVYAYWFMTTCHELAHHFVHEHDANHGFYTSSFAETYMSKLIELMR
ncbi:hypothetical protein AYI68_g4089 [Smittium mucronatum]|uniref:Uncharacterized protein n=1 Tax=Smittium mucronatum TaxID=133383 RepID=A0A1R0GY18_9FUNG|nr:hypothetical protein AYI68_g4089 [Smittium mucronatum]